MKDDIFQANAKCTINGFDIAMLSDSVISKVRVRTMHIRSESIVDDQLFDYTDPAEIAAAFAKYSMSITWAATANLSEQVTSGL